MLLLSNNRSTGNSCYLHWQQKTANRLQRNDMSTLIDAPVSASYSEGKIMVLMESGLEIRFPIAGNPRLAGQSIEALNNIEVSPFGLHWPELDEDLSIRGILAGNYGQKTPRAA
jgi:hypothetical protein